MANNKKRHLAALKGWRTRRRHARSLAALKGWRTRHRRFKQRSAAAALGWLTRRKNAAKRQAHGKKRPPRRAGPFKRPSKALTTWIVTVKLHSDTVEGEISRQREVDFIVRAPASATHGKLIKLILANKCTVRWTLGGPKTGERPADVWRWMTKTLGSDRRDIFGEPYCQIFFIRQKKGLI